MIKSIKRYVCLVVYCFFMRKLWRFGYWLHNWTEDRRPGGGFYVKNLPD